MRLETYLRALDLSPASWNADDRTVDAVLSTGAAVARRDSRGPFMERLDLDAINPADLTGLPVLADHEPTTRATVGQIARAWFDGAALMIQIRLSDASDVAPIVQKIIEGSLRGVSAGYSVARWRDGTDASGRRERTAVDWRIHEASITPIPADRAALTRSSRPVPTEQNIEADRLAYRAEIRKIATRAGLTAEWADAQIDADATVEQVKAAAFDSQVDQRRAAPIIRAAVGFSNDDPAVITRRMSEALAADAAGVPVTDAGANQFRGMGFRGLIRAAVDSAPGARFMSDSAAIDAAFSRSAPAHSTSDFANVTLGAGSRIVAHAYGEAASPLESALVVHGTAPDFRPVSEIGLGGFGNLQPLSENGEIQEVSTVDSATTWSLGTYAARFDVSRKMLVNDDLGLFGRIGADLGRAARRTETAAVIALIVSNSGAGPTMSDATPLFHADHGNLAASGGALSDTTLPVAIQAVQAQTGLNGEIIGIRPAYLVVSPALEFTARKLLATIQPTTAADVNPLAGILDLIVEPRLSGNAWYLFAMPSAAPVLKIGHLAGQRGPVVQMQERWNGLGTSYRVFTDFGTTAVDWRGAYRNAGS